MKKRVWQGAGAGAVSRGTLPGFASLCVDDVPAAAPIDEVSEDDALTLTIAGLGDVPPEGMHARTGDQQSPNPQGGIQAQHHPRPQRSMLSHQNRKHHVIVCLRKTRQSHRPSRPFTTQTRHAARCRGKQSFRGLISNVIVVPRITSKLGGVRHDAVYLVRLKNMRQPCLSRLRSEQHATDQ